MDVFDPDEIAEAIADGHAFLAAVRGEMSSREAGG